MKFNILFVSLFAIFPYQNFSSYTVESKSVNYSQSKVVSKVEDDLLFIRGGTYLMGCDNAKNKCRPDEKPKHKVSIDDFYIGKYEITNIQFCEFLNSNHASANAFVKNKEMVDVSAKTCGLKFIGGKFIPKKGLSDYPVVGVTWYGASLFCEWAGVRLPTEAEWEYAAKGGQLSHSFLYSGSNDLNEVAWYFDNSKNNGAADLYEGHGVHEVGTKKPNELGIFDMNGNVWEWCFDFYSGDYYKFSPSKNPTGPKIGRTHVLRGGSWGDNSQSCRNTYRIGIGSGSTYFMYGFRVAKDAKTK